MLRSWTVRMSATSAPSLPIQPTKIIYKKQRPIRSLLLGFFSGASIAAAGGYALVLDEQRAQTQHLDSSMSQLERQVGNVRSHMQRVQIVEQRLDDLPVIMVHKDEYRRDREYTQEQIDALIADYLKLKQHISDIERLLLSKSQDSTNGPSLTLVS